MNTEHGTPPPPQAPLIHALALAEAIYLSQTERIKALDHLNKWFSSDHGLPRALGTDLDTIRDHLVRGASFPFGMMAKYHASALVGEAQNFLSTARKALAAQKAGRAAPAGARSGAGLSPAPSAARRSKPRRALDLGGGAGPSRAAPEALGEDDEAMFRAIDARIRGARGAPPAPAAAEEPGEASDEEGKPSESGAEGDGISDVGTGDEEDSGSEGSEEGEGFEDDDEEGRSEGSEGSEGAPGSEGSLGSGGDGEGRRLRSRPGPGPRGQGG